MCSRSFLSLFLLKPNIFSSNYFIRCHQLCHWTKWKAKINFDTFSFITEKECYQVKIMLVFSGSWSHEKRQMLFLQGFFPRSGSCSLRFSLELFLCFASIKLSTCLLRRFASFLLLKCAFSICVKKNWNHFRKSGIANICNSLCLEFDVSKIFFTFLKFMCFQIITYKHYNELRK